MLWHRLRGHKIKRITRTITGIAWDGEYGYERHTKRCSCGTTWTLVCVNPLQGKWKWL